MYGNGGEKYKLVPRMLTLELGYHNVCYMTFTLKDQPADGSIRF